MQRSGSMMEYMAELPSLFSYITGAYFRTMALFVAHSTLAQGLGWIKFIALSCCLFICTMLPFLWPVVLAWLFYKYKAYKASCAELLPEWTAPDIPLEKRLMNAVNANTPKVSSFFINRDSLRLKYYIEGSGNKHILICNGVNCSWLLWKPVFDVLDAALGKSWREEFKVVTWEYRGLYESQAPTNTAGFSVRALCNDANDLLQHLQLERWDCVCGWSTGVQAALEYAGLYPKTVDRVFLVNGSHGHTLRFAFQPVPQIITFPLMGHFLESLIWFARFRICSDEKTFETTRALFLRGVALLAPTLFRLQAFLLSRASLEYTMATNAVDLVAHGPQHCNNVARILQTLDCHSASYNLPELKPPVLIVAGLLDFMTPAFTQYEIAALAPRARLVPFAAGTHHCILEFPQQASKEIASFLMTDTEQLSKGWGHAAGGSKVEWPIAWGLS